ncbi:MAG: hypothetical protein ACRD1N_11295, partial [Terriglobia bacterium]
VILSEVAVATERRIPVFFEAGRNTGILRCASSKINLNTTPISIAMRGPKTHVGLRMTGFKMFAKKARSYDLAMQRGLAAMKPEGEIRRCPSRGISGQSLEKRIGTNSP